MSTDYGIRCLRCGVDTPEHYGRLFQIVDILQHRDLVVSLAVNSSWVEVVPLSSAYGEEITRFLVDHRYHEMCPINEYGNLEPAVVITATAFDQQSRIVVRHGHRSAPPRADSIEPKKE